MASLPGLLIALLVGLMISFGAAVWVGVLIALLWNGYMLWRSRSPRLNWVIAVCAERVYVRLFAKRGRKQANVEPEILVLESSEIASMSAHTIDLFLYGPKPKVVEWLVIEPASAVAEEVSDHIRPLKCGVSPNVCGIKPIDPDKQVFVGNEEGPLTIEWKWCRPALRTFLRRVAQQCPSILVGPEQCSELDLNGIWHGFREEPNAQQRRMLAQATRLGFGSKLVQLLSLYRFCTFPSYRKATAYLAEIEREETETEHAAVPQ
ncbi:MAG: hypothetical protein WCA10_05940 [Terracidiphilus sp.]